MKRAKRHAVPKPRDPAGEVPPKRTLFASPRGGRALGAARRAQSPLMRKGGAHGKTTAAKRRADAMALAKLKRDPELGG